MQIERHSPCKVNFILNILGKRADGFHELETLLFPIQYCDRIVATRSGSGIQLSCSDPALATDSTNLVYRAAMAFIELTGIGEGIAIHLEKRIPMAAGLGGGSGNAAATLLALNDLFDKPLASDAFAGVAAGLGGGSGNAAATLLALNDLFDKPLALDAFTGVASRLGSDVPFFLQTKP
ncbi:MAG: 4-diphosphocytidyl-2C-methyl-D-erythritol kinase, partial [Verrucomicrobiales bacterium]|nr:4-diphosphocytidyl-2C-methyl-D-erythritol kinase [Verrucomicrobiales bacterium]